MKKTMTIALLLSLTVCLSTLVAADDESTPAPAPVHKNPKVLMKTSMGDITIELFELSAPKTVANFLGLANGTKEFKDVTSGKMVKRPFYDGLTFHRVIPNFMLQGGCPKGNGMGGPGYNFEDEINAKSLGLDKIRAVKDGQPAKSLLIRNQQDFRRLVLSPLFKKLGITNQEQLTARKDELQKAVDALTVMDVYVNLGYKYDDSLKSFGNTPGTLAMANSGPNTNGSQFFINLVDNAYLNGKHTVFGKVVSGMDVARKIEALPTGAGAKPVKIVSVRRIVE